MKRINGEIYVTIGEAAEAIGRRAQQIKNWYEWYEMQPEEVKQLRPLPKIYIFDLKGTRYFKESDLPMLEAFRDSIHYGLMAEVSKRKWGRRGSQSQN